MGEHQAPEIEVALQHEREGRAAEAIASLREAARTGDAAAQYLLAVRLLPSGNGASARAQGSELLAAAAAQGFGEALHFSAVLAAAGFDGAPNWDAAMAHLKRAAARGHQRAQAQLDVLGDAFSAADWLHPPPARMQFDHPKVGGIEKFLPKAMCDWLMAAAAPRLSPAPVRRSNGEAALTSHRTNTGAGFSLLQSDLIVRLAQARLGLALGVAANQYEYPIVLRYTVGQTFKPHRDALEASSPELVRRLAQVGQRVATFLIYLNEDYAGGETDFPLLKWRFRGRTGDALFFWNVDEAGAPERALLHAGLPPTSGEKWVFSQWVRAKPVPLI